MAAVDELNRVDLCVVTFEKARLVVIVVPRFVRTWRTKRGAPGVARKVGIFRNRHNLERG
jgi:hypothetical protein